MSEPPNDKLSIWTVCWSPSDYPGKFTARLHYVGAGGTWPTTELIVADSYAVIRKAMDDKFLHRMGRHPDDDPCIVECWL